MKKRIAAIVYVNLDEVRGSFHTEDLAVESIGRFLNDRIPHYDPRAYLAPPNMQKPHGKKRITVIVYVDLDEVSGNFNTENTAVESIQQFLNDRIPHYDPQAILAPPHMQMPHGSNVTRA